MPQQLTPEQLDDLAQQLVNEPTAEEAELLKQKYIVGFYGDEHTQQVSQGPPARRLH